MIHNHLLAIEDEERFAERVNSVLDDALANYSQFSNRDQARNELMTEVQVYLDHTL
jgi:hypothetical protein